VKGSMDFGSVVMRKPIRSTRHEYLYANDKLYAYEVGCRKIFFFYDENKFIIVFFA